MSTQTFLPRPENERIDWLQDFADALPNFAKKYGLTDEQVDDVQTGLAFIIAWYTYKIELESHKTQVTAYFAEQLYGVSAGATGSVLPVQPAIPALTAPPPGILSRALAIGKSMKKQIVYTEADGEALGLIGVEHNIDFNSLKAQITIKLVNGGHPEIHWLKHGLDGIQIFKDSGTGTFSLLAYVTHPPTIDNAPLPAAGTSAIWRYKTIYMHNDMPVGEYSDVVSVTVTGE
jgi:hypothetical protein